MFREHTSRLEQAFSALSPEERGQLESLLKKAGKHAEQLTRKAGQADLAAVPIAGKTRNR